MIDVADERLSGLILPKNCQQLLLVEHKDIISSKVSQSIRVKWTMLNIVPLNGNKITTEKAKELADHKAQTKWSAASNSGGKNRMVYPLEWQHLPESSL